MSRRDLSSTIDYAIDNERRKNSRSSINPAAVFDEVSRILPADSTPKALIFITDQQSTLNVDDLKNNAKKQKLEDDNLVEIFAVAVGTNSKEEPAALASTPDNVFSVSEYSNLPRISEEFVRRLGICKNIFEICNLRYLVGVHFDTKVTFTCINIIFNFAYISFKIVDTYSYETRHS